MNDGSGIEPEYEEIWLRNILNTYGEGDHRHSQPFITCVSTAVKKQAGCSLTGRFVMNSFIGKYYNATGVGNYYGQYVCNKKDICGEEKGSSADDIPCYDRKGNEACAAPNVGWHPSPHRHRVMAETFAVSFLNAVIEAIDGILRTSGNIQAVPSYGLACLLEDYLSDIEGENKGELSQSPSAAFERPLVEPQTACGATCKNAMWCAISFWPAPKHNQLHRFFVGNDGFYNNDTIDTPVDPLIMRNGGRAPVDHKAQWTVDRKRVGAYLEIKVTVPTRYNMILYPQGIVEKIAIAQYYSAFEFRVDGKKRSCTNTTYDHHAKPEFCMLNCKKPGKYTLKMTLVSDENPYVDDTYTMYAIDEIAGI